MSTPCFLCGAAYGCEHRTVAAPTPPPATMDGARPLTAKRTKISGGGSYGRKRNKP